MRDLDFTLELGEFAVIMGASGSGKSTLLNMLAGLDRPTRGRVTLDRAELQQMSETELALLRRRSVGFVFQAINLVPNLTLIENIVVPGRLLPANGDGVEAQARSLLQAVGLAELGERLPAQVSSGQQQRAAIARALINRPRVLLADEPTGALDSASGGQVLDLLDQLHAGGQTMLLVTHDVKVASHGQRVVYLRDGAVQGTYRPDADVTTTPVQREQQLTAWLAQMEG